MHLYDSKIKTAYKEGAHAFKPHKLSGSGLCVLHYSASSWDQVKELVSVLVKIMEEVHAELAFFHDHIKITTTL